MTQKLCPVCNKTPADAAHAPFCSKRCADVDLNRWFTGRYAIPAAEADESSEDTVPDAGSDA